MELYSYDNYRKFLSDYYKEHKANELKFSWRVWARRAGFGSPVFLKLVVDGAKNLGSQSIDRVAHSCGMTGDETSFFHALVAFTHADTDHERNFYFGEMSAIRSKTGVATVITDQFDYFSQWFIPVVREVVSGMAVIISDSEIASKIRPEVTSKQIKHALSVLVSLGFIRDINGIWRQESPLLATEPAVQSLAIRNFHNSMLNHAGTALRELPVTQRSISGTILKLSPEGYTTVVKKIDTFREELLQIAASDNDVNRVFHLGVQIYPVSKELE